MINFLMGFVIGIAVGIVLLALCAAQDYRKDD